MKRESTPDFPVVASVVAGQIGAGVAFAVAARLRNLHGSGEGIGSQVGAGIAHAAGQAEKQVRGNGVLEENLAAGFEIGDVLALARLLLDEFVGNQEAHGVVNQGDAQAIAARKIRARRKLKSRRHCRDW